MAKQMTLGQLIEALERKDPTDNVDFGFGYFSPTHFMSWRGSYGELALGYGHWSAIDFDKRPTVSSILVQSRAADGRTFEGYKGGLYTMGRDNRIWIANNGESCSSGLADVVEHDGGIVLVTAPFEWM